MKVLLVNTEDSKSGSARAAQRLLLALKNLGVDTHMYVKEQFTDDPVVFTDQGKVDALINKGYTIYSRFIKRSYQIENSVSFSPAIAPDHLLDHIDRLKPDIVHLHWFNKSFIKLETLKSIKQPVVWTLHDMWGFTGGCHYTQGCDKYRSQCGACPVLNSNNETDLSKKIYLRKLRTYQNLPRQLTIITPSRWLGKCVEESSLLGSHPVTVIPNALDTNVYTPIEKSVAKQILKIPLDKKIILFGAAKLDPRKGYHLLIESLKYIKHNHSEIYIFGSSVGIDADKQSPIKINYLGKLQDDISLALVYAAADVMVVPSIEEVFGQTASEAMACGTPVVAFGSTGLLDIIDHKINGYLAKPLDQEDLALGIDWVLEDDERRGQMSKMARQKVVEQWDLKNVGAQTLALYEKCLTNAN